MKLNKKGWFGEALLIGGGAIVKCISLAIITYLILWSICQLQIHFDKIEYCNDKEGIHNYPISTKDWLSGTYQRRNITESIYCGVIESTGGE